MNDMGQVIARVLERIRKFRSLYEQNEMAIRDQVVNPILRSLGWDPENPEEVQPNLSTEDGVPDYTLIKDGKKKLFVEAKKLSIDVEQPEVMRQLAKYSFSEGTKYGVLTNGAVWMFIRSFEEGTKLAERIVWKADLENEKPADIARKLITITRENVERVETLVKKVEILNEICQSLLQDPDQMASAILPLAKSAIIQTYPSYQFEDAEIQDVLKQRVEEMVSAPGTSDGSAEPQGGPVVPPAGEPPAKMKLAGQPFEVRYSFEILVKTANWLIEKGKLSQSDCPVPIGHKRNLVNMEPKHKYGDSFRAPKRVTNGLWIEAHYSTAMCISNARRLLERFGIPGSSLSIE